MVAKVNLTSDSSWVRNVFMSTEDLSDEDTSQLFFTTAKFAWTDSSIGGAIEINPLPQFTPTADIRVPGLYSRAKLGRYYHEAIQKNARRVHFRMGVPAHNSLFNYLTRFYNAEQGILARTGRAPGLAYTLGKISGFVVAIAAWEVSLLLIGGAALNYLMGKPASKYYYLKPAMPLYWNAVNTMVNHIAVYKGIVPRVKIPFVGSDSVNNTGPSFSADDLANLNRLLPDIFRPGGGIDVYALANRGQRLYMQFSKKLNAAINEATSEEGLQTKIRQFVADTKLSDENVTYYDTYLQRWLGASSLSNTANFAQGGNSFSEAYPSVADNDTPGKVEQTRSWWQQTAEFFKAELNDGSAFVTFRVDNEDSVSESFSNTYAESAIQSKLNGFSSEARSAYFNFAGGNVAGGTGIGDVAGWALQKVGEFAAGNLDTLGLGGLLMAAGGAYADIPQTWQNSTASLPRMNYTFTLTSPYAGNKLAQLLYMYIPLSCAMCMGLPISTGRQSHAAPFLVEFYDQGRFQSRLAGIDGISVVRGVTNLPFNNRGEALSIKVTLSLVDLSSVMSMPVSAGFTFDIRSIFDDETVWTDYMSALSSVGLYDNIYPMQQLSLRMTRLLTSWDSYFSWSHAANWLIGTGPGQLLTVWERGIAR